jgi:hypothetical protein
MKALWLMSATLFACSNEAPIMETTLTSSGMHVDVDPAAEQITSDRCNRQLSCGNVGKGHTWNDRRHCEVDAAPKVRNVLGVSCSSIDATRLSTCLDEIRDQRCAETGSMPASCEGVQLCR